MTKLIGKYLIGFTLIALLLPVTGSNANSATNEITVATADTSDTKESLWYNTLDLTLPEDTKLATDPALWLDTRDDRVYPDVVQ